MKTFSEKVSTVDLGRAEAEKEDVSSRPFPGWMTSCTKLSGASMVTGSLFKKKKKSPKTSFVMVVGTSSWHILGIFRAHLSHLSALMSFRNTWVFSETSQVTGVSHTARKATWQPARVCLLNHRVGIWHPIPALHASGLFECSGFVVF